MATVSRSTERHAVDDLLSSADIRPSGLVFAGEPGIGKTTLWLGGVTRARERGFRVLSTRADEAESVLAYAAIADLLADVEPDVIDALSELQRVAIDRVLLRGAGDGPPTDQRVTASAVAAIVTALTADGPVLLAVDDAQWLDVSSQAVLAFAVRRVSGPVGILLTARANPAEPDPARWLQLRTPDAVNHLRVRPLSLGAMNSMISERFGKALPRPTMVRIAEISGGNPFYALELARAVDGRSSGSDSALPSTLAELVRLRTQHFDGEVGDMLLAACSVTEASVDLLARATGVSVDGVVDLLEGPEREGIVQIDGSRVRFVHPLLARGIYTQAGPARRRRMHRTLAAVETQPELKARHMALGAASADPATLSALDIAAEAAVARGAAAAAADLYELAIGLGGNTPTRRLRAAEQHLRAGDTRTAATMAEVAVADLEPGPLRATALTLLGAARMAEHDFPGAVAPLSDAAAEAGDDLELRVKAQLWLCRAQTMTGKHDAALRQAEVALENAERLGLAKLTSQALTLHVMLTCTDGAGRDEDALRRALELEAPDPDVGAPFQASVADAVTLGWTGRLDESLAGLIAARRRCVEIGSDADLVFVTGYLALVYVWLGRYSVAVELADDILRRGELLGGAYGYPLIVATNLRAVASSYLGRERATRDDARAALNGARTSGAHFLTAWPLMALGFLEVSLGNFPQALDALQPLLTDRERRRSNDVLPASYLADAVEAMTAVGRLTEAAPLVDALERDGAKLDRPWMLAVGARCRSMLLAAGGELAAAEEMLQRAMVEHDRLPMPFERARTQLFLGQLLRRQRRKNLAAAALREALGTFEELGSKLWADRVRAELARTNAPRSNHAHLTPSELRVARLAASGMTNKDIASALFISPKTVEHNLSSVYRKLSVRTRAELARRAGELDED